MKKTFANSLFSFAVCLAMQAVPGSALGQLYGASDYGGPTLGGYFFKTEIDGSGYTIIKTLRYGEGGNMPLGALVKLPNGKLYGVTQTSVEGGGTIFEYDPATGEFAVKYEFPRLDPGGAPTAGLMLASNGKLYGVVNEGDATNDGYIYEFDPATAAFTKRADFILATTGTDPESELVEAPNGKLYGTTFLGGANGAGTIYEYNPVTNVLTKVFDMPGGTDAGPTGALCLAANGKFYGNATGYGDGQYGVLFEYDYINDVYTKKQDFVAPGPEYIREDNGLMQADNGKLYGLSSQGGDNGKGCLYEYDPALNVLTVLHSFETPMSFTTGRMMQASNGKLYGTVQIPGHNSLDYILFEFNLATSQFSELVSVPGWGGNPTTLIEYEPGKLFGADPTSGSSRSGTIFEFNINSGSFLVNKTFYVAVEGGSPRSTLTRTPTGTYAGTMAFGGLSNDGVIYEIDPGDDSWVKTGNFDRTTIGRMPHGPMALYENGKMYGLTQMLGDNPMVTVFEYDPVTKALTKKVSLLDVGGEANSGLLLGPDEMLYGVTNQFPTIFQYNPRTNVVANKASLSTIGGSSVQGGLALGPDEMLYGFASSGGTSGTGIIFRYDPFAGTLTKLHDFTTSSGSKPVGTPIFGTNGKIYGVTREGGSAGQGTIFEFDVTTRTNSVKHHFSSATGHSPASYMVLSPNGKLYGLTPFGGASDSGVLFEYDYLGSGYSVVKHFAVYEAGGQMDVSMIALSKAQHISFNRIPDKFFSVGSFNISAVASSALPVLYESSNPEIVSVSGNTLTFHRVGTVVITAKQPGNSFFDAAPPMPRTLNVLKDNQTITFAALADKVYGDEPFTLNATATSALPVSFESANTSVLTISGNTATIVGAGSAEISASQGGSDIFNPAPVVKRTIVIQKKDQAITFEVPPTKNFGDQFTPTATATSGLAVQFSSTSGTITITNGTVNCVAGGIATISAQQPGDTNYKPATAVSRSFCVNPPKPTITFSADNGGQLTSSSATGNSWFKDNEVINNAVNQVLQPTQGGTYTVQVTITGCISPASDGFALVVTGSDEVKRVSESMKLSPNPCTNRVYVEWTTDPIEITIYDLLGRIVHHSTMTEDRMIDTNNFAKGTYLVRGISDNQRASFILVRE